MTREARRTFRVGSLSVDQINFALGLIADRLDELEGRRGTPQFKNNVDMGANRITSVGDAVEISDAITLGSAASAANSAATSIVNSALSPVQNWVTFHRIVDSNGTITHGFNATNI